ncbi:YrhK family protein [Demequina aestuarii]|uniref:YrhK family protein n=1 Tax=Demequina aestuarii TaxID=327095 RepID=UPI000783A9F8|nr:YrhK family protein [Demequina aestuarii]
MSDERSGSDHLESDSSAPAPGPSQHSAFTEPEGNLSFRIGSMQIDVDNRWEAASILNDIMTGLWFLAGSTLNVLDVGGDWSLYLYLAGSVQLLARAFFRLERRIHAGGGHQRSRPRMYRPDIDA